LANRTEKQTEKQRGKREKEREDSQKEKSVLSVQTVYLTGGESERKGGGGRGAGGLEQDHAQICFGLGQG
jgi:hypothetical protein